MASRGFIAAPLGNASGFALMVVIVVLLLVSVLASQLILQIRAEQQVALHAEARSSGRYLAEAGVQLALFRLLDKPLEITDPASDEPLRQGTTYEATLPTGMVSYAVVNETGKLDLNAAPAGLLALFFEHQGLTPEEAAVVIDSLQDWRDADDLHRVNGAEREVYQALAHPYIPRNGAIEEVAEFRLIHGTSRLADAFAPEEVFTVHNPQGKINCNSLTPAMLDFVMDGDSDRMQAYREAQNASANLNTLTLRQLMGEGRYAVLGQHLNCDAGSPFYTITAVGRPAAAAAGVKAHAIVRLAADSYQLLAWREEGI